jgi:phosphoribosylaminoimidazolecarboxamide formyltransferase/IMP cyclohydrolase
LEEFFKHINKLRGGVLYTDSLDIIKKLKNNMIDCILTTADINQEDLLSYKSMVFKMDRFDMSFDQEYIIDEDIVIKQEYKNLIIDSDDYSKLAFEIAKMHKSDSIVYLKGNRIYSGNQSSLNRMIALNTLEYVLNAFDENLNTGTMIFDSPINDERIIKKLEDWNINELIVPPPLPKDKQYLETLKQKGFKIIVTPNRYHKY